VVTLIEAPNVCCKGMAYRVSPDVFAQLDVREKNGYLRFVTSMIFADGTREDGLVYIATEDNAAFLGPADDAEIARQIAASEGRSGRNRDYLLNLATALRALGDDDPHVFALESYLR
jgi:cation transport regulator ChaC